MSHEERPKKISEETIGENPWWKYQHDTYKKPNGKVVDYFYAQTPGNAMVVPVTSDGRLILVTQYRYLSDRVSIEFPCGGMKVGESAVSAAERELKEETGYSANNLRMVGNLDPDIGLVKDRTYVFLATDVDVSDLPAPDPEEIAEVLFRRADEFEDMIRRGEIINGQTLAAWAITREFVHQKFGVN